MTTVRIHGRGTIYRITVNGDELPSKGDALASAKRRAAGEDPHAAIIKKDEEAVYVATWSE